MQISLQPAFVLHSRPYRETSLIVDLLTKDYGRISVIARGVRTSRSKTKSLLQPFVPVIASWYGKHELMTLSSVEPHGLPIRLQGDCLLSAFYLNELLIRVLHKHDAHAQLYTIYHETLVELQHHELQPKTLRIFEKKLLEEIGYGLQLQYDVPDGRLITAEQQYCFYSEQGFKVFQGEDNIPKAWIFSGKSLLAIAQENLVDPECLKDAKRLMRLALAPLLGTQPLQSRKLFLEVEKE